MSRDDLASDILTEGLVIWGRDYPVINAFNHQVETMPRKKGQTFKVPDVGAIKSRDVTPGVYPSGNPPVTHEEPKLTEWKEAFFTMDDTEMENFGMETWQGHITQCIERLATDVEDHVLGNYQKAFTCIGTPGTTPFSDGKHEVGTRLKQGLKNNKMPGIATCVLSPDAEAEALNLPLFINANQSGSTAGVNDGVIGRKLGVEWRARHDMPNHVTTGSNDWLVNGADQNAFELTVDTGTTPPAAGDVFTIAGSEQQYAVDQVFGGTVWKIYPQLESPPDNAAITFLGSHEVNFAFHRNALSMGWSRFETPSDIQTRELAGGQGGVFARAWSFHPTTGVPMRLEIIRGYKEYYIVFDILFGSSVRNRNHLARLVG